MPLYQFLWNTQLQNSNNPVSVSKFWGNIKPVSFRLNWALESFAIILFAVFHIALLEKFTYSMRRIQIGIPLNTLKT